MTSPSLPPDPVTTTEIADLLSWARQLSASGSADPAQRAAYLAAKANLLARIADHHADGHPCHASQARQVADQARDLAAQANALHQPKDSR
ncbi:hypothetical protein [Micromonospora globbae]|uniref:hypothetical protein n=1 Tax=Micromonospora globbae TaxID=1894969 RepID=UPI00341E788E